MVFGEKSAANLQRLLEERLGLGELRLIEEDFACSHNDRGRSVGDAILLRHRAIRRNVFNTPICVHGLEVLRPLGSCPQGKQFFGPRNRLFPSIGLHAASMALSSSSARFASSPDSFCNPGAGACACFADVVWAVVRTPGIAITAGTISINRTRIRRSFHAAPFLVSDQHCQIRERIPTAAV